MCFRWAKDKRKGTPAVIVCVYVSQQTEWHTAGSVKLGMTYFIINQRLPHSSLRNISNTLPHMLKHMCRARRHHVLWVNYENWLKTFQTMSEEGTVKRENLSARLTRKFLKWPHKFHNEFKVPLRPFSSLSGHLGNTPDNYFLCK